MRTHENTNVIAIGPAHWRGLNRGVDPQDVPPGQFYDGRDLTCNWPTTGQVQTRPGLSRVTDRLYLEPFAIMPGARGKTWTPPGLKVVPPPDDGGAHTFTMSAAPATGLFVNDNHPAQAVTFYVYGGTELGITSYDWTFGDGGTQSGSAESVNHDYTSPATVTATVSGIGTDGNTYNASLTLTISRNDGPPPPPETPAECEIKVNGEDNVVLEAAGNVTVTWTSKNATQVLLGTEVVAASGTRSESVTDASFWALYAYGEDGGMAYDMATASVKPVTPPGMTATLTANGQESLTLSAPGNVTLDWSTSGATTVRLGGEAVASSGARQVYVGEDSTFSLSAQNATGETAADSCSVTVTDNPNEIDAALLVDGKDETFAVEANAPVLVNWVVTGASRITLDGQAVAAEGNVTRTITQEHTFVLEAYSDGGGRETKSVTVQLKEPSGFPTDLMQLRILGPDTAESGDPIALTYELWGRRSAEAALERAAYTGDLVADSTAVRVTSGYAEVIPLANEASHASTGLAATLDTGAGEGEITVTAYLHDAQSVLARKTIKITMPKTAFSVDVLDQNLDPLTDAYAVGEGATFLLQVTALMPGTAVTDLAFAGAAALDVSCTGASPAENQTLGVTLLSCLDSTGAVLVDLAAQDDPGVIPAEGFTLGVALVLVNVSLATAAPSFPEYAAVYQNLEFTAQGVD